MEENILSQYPIKMFKLITGEETVAYFCREDDTFIYVRVPLSIVPTQTGLKPIPFSLGLTIDSGDIEVPIYKHSIITMFDAPETISVQYKSTTIGIDVGPSKKIVKSSDLIID